MPRIAYLGPEGTFTEAALLRIAENGMVPVAAHPTSSRPYPRTAPARRWPPCGPAMPTTRACRSRTRSRGRCCRRWTASRPAPELQVFAELTLDVAFTIVVRSGTTAADVRIVAAFPVAQRAGAQLAGRQPAERSVDTGQLQRRGGQRCRRRPRRRRREHRAGGAAVRADRTGIRRRRRAQRQDPLRAGRPARAAAAEHRRGPHVGGVATRQRPRCAGRRR